MKPSDLNFDTLPYVLTADQTTLWEALSVEFDQLNAAHFEGRLTKPEIVISTRKTYGGYYQPSRHRIVVSWQAFVEHGLPEALNTFRHEVAHIVHPNHSAAFWNLAATLGVNRRYASAPKVRPAPRYIYACPVCEWRYERRRRIKTASCASCDSRYNPRYALRLVSSEGS